MSIRECVAGALAGVLLAACGGDDGGTASRRDTMTQRQRDSTIGASALPGAHGVTRALGVSDSAAAQRARIDSLSRP